MDDGGHVRQRAGIQRDECVGKNQRRGVAATDDGDDPGGVGESDRGDQRVARCDLQGQRQLLSRGDIGPEWRTRWWGYVWWRERGDAWVLGFSRKQVDPPGSDLRRRDVAAVCEW